MKTTTLLIVLAVGVTGCKDPGAKVTGASVEEGSSPAAVAPPTKDAPAAGALAVNPSNSKVEFVGAKVTASHPGGFTDFAGTVEVGDFVTVDITLRSDGESAFGLGGSAIGYDESIVGFQSGIAAPDVLVQVCVASVGCFGGLDNNGVSRIGKTSCVFRTTHSRHYDK